MDMATYSTIGAVEADKALLEKPKASFKGLVAGAAVVSFVLGVMAAVATTPTALRGEAAFIAAPGAPGAAAKPFHFSRVVDSVAPGYGFEWTFEPAASCTSDQYGAATCDFAENPVIPLSECPPPTAVSSAEFATTLTLPRKAPKLGPIKKIKVDDGIIYLKDATGTTLVELDVELTVD